MDEHEQNGVHRSHRELESTGADVVRALEPLFGNLQDVTHVVIVARRANGSFSLLGPHRIIEASMLLASFLETVGRSLTQADLVDFMVDQVDIPENASAIDGIV